jgi:hypothetical protein
VLGGAAGGFLGGGGMEGGAIDPCAIMSTTSGKNQSVPVHLRYYREREVDKCRYFYAKCLCTNLDLFLAVG